MSQPNKNDLTIKLSHLKSVLLNAKYVLKTSHDNAKLASPKHRKYVVSELRAQRYCV